MLILSLKPSHDGAIAAISDGDLLFSHEGEKDSYPRYDTLNVDTLLRACRGLDRLPDVVCHSGWMKERLGIRQGAGYLGTGLGSSRSETGPFFGKDVVHFTSSHERSHIWSSYGMSPFPQGQPVHCLVYEGAIGRFYSIDERLGITAHPTVIDKPGIRYSFLYHLADPRQSEFVGQVRLESAGKLMALAAFGEPGPPDAMEQTVIDWILQAEDIGRRQDKQALRDTPYFNCGLDDQRFRNLARKVSDTLIGLFVNDAKRFRDDRRPLLISGGCGLNCDWNRTWEESGCFEDLFIPPVTNDTGSAIGTAVDAQQQLTGNAKISWGVYSGMAPNLDLDARLAWSPVDPEVIAADLLANKVVAVMKGRCELGPRALGARSLLAAPFDAATTHRLNTIKKREQYRPIAPVVVEHRAQEFFDLKRPSSYMLHFARVLDPRLRAVTHVDGSARPQTVSSEQNPFLFEVLEAFGRISGVPVLCNTSLNYPGRGFINTERDLVNYCLSEGVDCIVCEDRYARVQTQ